jgi:hypothetical protein
VLADMVRIDRQLRPTAGNSMVADAVQVVARAHKTLIWERTRQRLRWETGKVTFDLSLLPASVEGRAARWNSLGVAWTVNPVAPNHGKPVVVAEFESEQWAGDLIVWITGEAEMVTIRIGDGWTVSKHYDLALVADLEVVLEDVAMLVRVGAVPKGAITGEGSPG